MSKYIFSLLLIGSLAFGSRASAQETRVKFYYYPSANVYYNVAEKDYWYYNPTTSTWTVIQEVPDQVNIVKTPKYIIYYSDANVWKENTTHLKKFKVKKDGEIKIKPEKDKEKDKG
jgi:hypothetical protein